VALVRNGRTKRCENEAALHADNPLEFGVDRFSRFGDRGRRNISARFYCLQWNSFHASDALKYGLYGAWLIVNWSK
jgi:hypothetical protein